MCSLYSEQLLISILEARLLHLKFKQQSNTTDVDKRRDPELQTTFYCY